MNALQRLQETQETLQGVAARLRIDIAGLTVPELAGVVATEAIKLHDELVHARSSLADMERQRDEARAALKSYEEADMALPSVHKDELWTVYQRKVAKLRASDLVLPAKVTT